MTLNLPPIPRGRLRRARVRRREAYLRGDQSSPPRHIDQKHVAAFFDRLEALRPDMAIFLEDTKLRMEDKLVKMFEVEVVRRLGPEPPAVGQGDAPDAL